MIDFPGTSGDDSITGSTSHDRILGFQGNDQLFGGAGFDTIEGGPGADQLYGGDDGDFLYSDTISPSFSQPGFGNPPVLDTGNEIDLLYGGAGDDTLFGGFGDTIDGGTGINLLHISFLGGTSGVTANFATLTGTNGPASPITVGGATLSNISFIRWVEGSNFDDIITMAHGVDSDAPVFGMAGNDTLVAGTHTQTMFGGVGHDLIDGRLSSYLSGIYGEDGDDILYSSIGGFGAVWGGSGNDTIYADFRTSGGSGNDIIFMQTSYYGAIITGDDGDDEIHAADNPYQSGRIFGGNGADWLIGNNDDDVIASGENESEASYSEPLDDVGLEHDRLEGHDGNDTLYAGIGDDVDGGSGTDTLRLSLGGASSALNISTGAVLGGGTLFGGVIQNVETLVSIKGSAFADNINATTQSSMLGLSGGAGDDVVTSNGSSVTFNGDDGNDTLLSGIAGDIFDGGAGADTISYAGYATGVTVTLHLTDTAAGTGAGGDQIYKVENITGSAHADTLSGNNLVNTLIGGDGNDILMAFDGDDTLIGGTGSDDLRGGIGSDSYFVDAGDSITEGVNQGTDRAYASASFALGAGQNVEFLSTNDDASTAAINLFGNELANTVTGNAGINILYGYDANDVLQGLGGNDVLVGGNGNDRLEGGSGDNELIGGLGDDSYIITNRLDTTYEVSGEGSDTVETTLFIYGLQSNIENLTLTDGAAHGAAVGNALGNVITGNSGVDDLFGREGNDTLRGGTGAANTLLGQEGDDLYIVEAAGDTVMEFANEGDDTVQTALSSFTLRDNVENLVFTGAGPFTGIGAGGTNRITGGSSNDFLSGLDGNDTLTGSGGNDELFGGTGADTFRFQGGDGIDRIYDFTSGSDKIGFVSWLFTVTGTLTLVQGSTPGSTSANTTILYNSSTGLLAYDLDGTGAIGAVPLAYLNPGLTLSLADFVYY